MPNKQGPADSGRNEAEVQARKERSRSRDSSQKPHRDSLGRDEAEVHARKERSRSRDSPQKPHRDSLGRDQAEVHARKERNRSRDSPQKPHRDPLGRDEAEVHASQERSRSIDSPQKPHRDPLGWSTKIGKDEQRKPSKGKERMRSGDLLTAFADWRVAADEAWRKRFSLAPGTRIHFWRSSALRRTRTLQRSAHASRSGRLTEAIARAWCKTSSGNPVVAKVSWRHWSDWDRLPLSCLGLCDALRASGKIKCSDVRAKLLQRSLSSGRQMSALPWKAGEVAARECSLDQSDKSELISRVYGNRSSDKVFEQPFIQNLLAQARRYVKNGAEWVLCIRTYGRSGLIVSKDANGAWIPKPRSGLRDMTLRVLEDAGFLNEWLIDRVHIFVSHEDDHFTSGRYAVALGPTWASRIIVGVKGADLQVRFIEECFCQGQHVVVCDDNLSWMRSIEEGPVPKYRELRQFPCELAELIHRTGIEMQQCGAHLWGLNQSSNVMHLKHNMSKSFGLIYGAFFGFICLHEPSLYTQFGQVKDDLERSLRYWDRDRIILRNKSFCVHKAQKPGKFSKSKGGISAALGENAHMEESEKAVHSMAHGFARDYVRLPEPRHDKRFDARTEELTWKAHVSDTGVIYCGSSTAKSHCDVEERVLQAGFLCEGCRTNSWKWTSFKADSFVFPLRPQSLLLDCPLCVDPVAIVAKKVFFSETLSAMGIHTEASRNLVSSFWENLSNENLARFFKAAAISLKVGARPKPRPLKEKTQPRLEASESRKRPRPMKAKAQPKSKGRKHPRHTIAVASQGRRNSQSTQ